MLSVAKTAVERHFSDALVSLRQASIRLLDPQSTDVSKWGVPHALLNARRKCRRLKPATLDNSTSVIVAERFERM
jgi:hypothetical protein